MYAVAIDNVIQALHVNQDYAHSDRYACEDLPRGVQGGRAGEAECEDAEGEEKSAERH